MYPKPFASLFGDASKNDSRDKDDLSLRSQDDPRDKKVEPPVSPIASTTSASPQIIEVVTPQFKSTTQMIDKDPIVTYETVQLSLAHREKDFNEFQLDISGLKRKISAANLYKNLLISYSSLSNQDKKALSDWTSANMSTVKNLSDTKSLKRLATRISLRNEKLDIKIHHLNKLLKFAKSGLIGSEELKYYQPTKPIVKADIPENGPPPIIFDPNAPPMPWYGLKTLGDVSASYYFNKMFHQMPAPKDFFNARRRTYDAGHLNKKIENAMLLDKQFIWKTNELVKEKDKQAKIYEDLQSQIKDLLGKILTTTVDSEPVTTTMGILVESFPESFDGVTILDGLKVAISQGDGSQVSVNQASSDAQSSIQKHKTKKDILNKLNSDLLKIS